MSKHTPGPFHSEPVSTVEMVGRNYAIRDTNLAVVAVFPSWKDSPEHKAEGAANRRMFMAGPDMIAALKGVVDEYGKRGGEGDTLLPADEQDAYIGEAMRVLDRIAESGE